MNKQRLLLLLSPNVLEFDNCIVLLNALESIFLNFLENINSTLTIH